MFHILITGGSGYIGNELVGQLVDRGEYVSCLDNLTTGNIEKVTYQGTRKEKNYSLYIGDIRNKDSLDELFKRSKPDVVVHMAAHSVIKNGEDNPRSFYSNNVTGGLNVLSAMVANGVKNIVFISSGSVYGDAPHPFWEEASCNPINVYGETKLVLENAIRRYARAYDIGYMILRLFNVAGASSNTFESHNPETHLVPRVVESIISGRAFEVHGEQHETSDGTSIRDFIHVSDAADIIIKAIYGMNYCSNSRRSSTICNVGSGKPVSILDVIQCAEKIAGKNLKITVSRDRRPGDPYSLLCNTKRMESFHWKASKTLEEIVKSDFEYRSVVPPV
jgi:UDP-glucose 4-epimerase